VAKQQRRRGGAGQRTNEKADAAHPSAAHSRRTGGRGGEQVRRILLAA
jgi:hypothetical protein